MHHPLKIILSGWIFIAFSLIAQANSTVKIKILEKPRTGKFNNLKGKVEGKQQELEVIACIYLGSWWSKSLKDGKPFSIGQNGKLTLLISDMMNMQQR